MRFAVFGLAVALSSCGAPSKSDTPAKTETAAAKPIEVTRLWAQPISGDGKSAAVYMTISAACPTQDVLQSVEAPAPQMASLHASSAVDGVLKMDPVKSMPIACGKENLMRPMGMHVMLMGIHKPIGIGTQLPLTLHFEHAGAIPVQAEVTSMAELENVDPMHMKHAAGGTKMDHGGMDHGKMDHGNTH